MNKPSQPKLLAAVAGLALVLAMSACTNGDEAPAGNPTNVATGTPITVGVINQQAGTAANLSQISEGYKAAAQYLNNELGGVDGHPVNIEVCATDGTPASTQTCAQKMVELKPLYVSIGIDNNMNVAYPLLQAAGIPVLGGSPSTNADIGATNARYWVGGTAAIVAGISGYIIKYMPNVKNVGLLVFNLASGQTAIPLMKDPLEAAGKTVQVLQVPTSQTDMLSPFTSLKNGGAEVIVALILNQQCVALAQAAQSQNTNIKFIMQPGCYSKALVKQAGTAMNGWIVPSYGPDPAGDDPEAKLFSEKMAQYAPSGTNVDVYSEFGFGGMMTIYNNILKPIGFDNLKSDKLLAKADEAAGGKTFLGAPYKCSAASKFPSICSFTSRHYTIKDSDGNLTDASNGQYTDALSVLNK